MKLFIICALFFSTLFFTQSQVKANTQLAYPEYPAQDQPEAMIANSLIFRKFDQDLFDKAQKEGKSILLIFSKSDCPGCRAQAPTLEKLLKNPEYKHIEVFQIDYMNQPQLNQRFNAKQWTLLVGFKGMNEVNRAPGQRSPSQLVNFLKPLLIQ